MQAPVNQAFVPSAYQQGPLGQAPNAFQATPNPMQPAYRPSVYRQGPFGGVRAGDTPELANLLERMKMSAVPGVSAYETRRDRDIPAQPQTDQPMQFQPAGLQVPTMPAMFATHPGAKPIQVLRTSNAVYHIIRPLDPRPKEPGTDHSMSLGIFLVKNKKTDIYFVEKRIRIDTPDRQARAQAEIDVLFQLFHGGASHHVNFIVEKFWESTSPYCSLVLEYCDDGSLSDSINRHLQRGMRPSESFVWHILAGLTKALCFTHYGLNLDVEGQKPRPNWNVICHLDIKPCNIFLDTRIRTGAYPRVVLGDFGCAVTYNDIQTSKADRSVQNYGTPGWLAPETHLQPSLNGIQGHYGMPTDIWQAGASVQALCWREIRPNQRLADDGTPCGDGYSTDLNDVIAFCMHRDVLKRPRAKDLVGEVKGQLERRNLPF